MTIVSDSFDGTSEMSANWSALNLGSPMYEHVSGQLAFVDNSVTPLNTVRWNANTFAGDQTAQITIKAFAVSEWTPGPALNLSSTVESLYRCSLKSNRLFVQKYVSGTATTIIDNTSVSFAVDDVIKMTSVASGTDKVIKVYQNGVEVASYTDTSPLTDTYIGIGSYYYSTDWRIDDFEGGDLVAASPTITLTPDPASVQVGSTRTFTATRSAAAGAGGVTYNVSSDNPAVATVPTPQALTEADSDLTFDATGVSVGTANITITNAADSSETDTVALTVTAVTTKKAKFLVHPDFASATGITIEVNEAPSGGALTGAKLGFATGIAAEATLEAGQAVIKVNAADVGASALTAGTSVRAIFKGTTSASSPLGNAVEGGSVVVATGAIIEE